MRGVHVPSREVIYLRSSVPGRTVDRRRYCTHCGLVREEGGKCIGYFTDRISAVQELLSKYSRRMGVRKLTEVERRLMVLSMERDSMFSDPFGSTFNMQRERFVELVRSFRPCIPEPMIEDLLR